MHLRDLGLRRPGSSGPAVGQGRGRRRETSDRRRRPRLRAFPGKPAEALPGRASEAVRGSRPRRLCPAWERREVAVIDELDKVHPVTGELIPAQPDGYLHANHLWNADEPA